MVLIYFDLTTDSNCLIAFDHTKKLRQNDKTFLSEIFRGIAFEMVFYAGFETCLFSNAN